MVDFVAADSAVAVVVVVAVVAAENVVVAENAVENIVVAGFADVAYVVNDAKIQKMKLIVSFLRNYPDEMKKWIDSN